MSDKKQQNERLSAFIDAEQSENEILQTVDDLIKNSDYKKQYIRKQLVNDCLNDQLDHKVLNTNLHKRIAQAIDNLPAHCVDTALELQSIQSETITELPWYKRWLESKLISGASVATSVMLVTLLTLQTFDNSTQQPAQTLAESNKQPVYAAPTFVQPHSQVPATLVSTANGNADTNDIKQRYRWIEADPALSRQVREYISEHEIHRAAFNLQPKIRSANYQIRE